MIHGTFHVPQEKARFQDSDGMRHGETRTSAQGEDSSYCKEEEKHDSDQK